MTEAQRLLVLYASQTGSAQDLAELLGRDGGRRAFKVTVESMDVYDRANLVGESLVIFVASTTGDGDPPDSMRTFWRFLLRKGLPKSVLAGLNFIVFGLGDSSYDKFNSVARKLRNRLIQLGGNEVSPPCWGDDQNENGVEGDFDNWSKLCWQNLLEIHPLPDNYIIDHTPQLPPQRFKIIRSKLNSEQTAENSYYNTIQPPTACYNKMYVGTVKSNQRLTCVDWEQDVRHLEIQAHSTFHYEAGDIAVVYPSNSGVDVDGLAQRLDLNVNEMIEVYEGSRVVYGPTSIGELFVRYLDVLGTPKRSALEALSFFTADEDETEKLIELSGPQGNDLYASYCKKEGRTFLDILDDFKTLNPTLEILMEIIPRIAPREYSISSSPTYHGAHVIHITVALVQYTTPWKRLKRGVCSQYLDLVKPGDKLPLCIKRGTLRIPEDGSSKLICIGPGTGVAPMRSLIYERFGSSNERLNTSLYFGCRHRDKDYIYSKEWEGLVTNKCLSRLRVAFSRDVVGKKVYVQKLLKEDRELLKAEVLLPNSYLYISGSAKRMPGDVKEAIVDVLSDDMSVLEAKKYIQRLERCGRLKIEAWG